MSNVITFKFLRELQKKEKDSNELQELDKNFYPSIIEYLNRKIKLSEDEEELNHTKVVIKDIFNRRERKIIDAAILSARSDITPKKSLPEEQQFFKIIKEKVMNYREQFSSLLGKKKIKQSETIEKEDIDEETVATKNIKTLKLKFLSSVPEFVDENLNTYGPFDEGEESELPMNLAKVLLNQGKAEQL